MRFLSLFAVSYRFTPTVCFSFLVVAAGSECFSALCLLW